MTKKDDRADDLHEPDLVSIFGNHSKTLLLDVLSRGPEKEFTAGNLAEFADIHRSTVHRNLEDLIDIGIVDVLQRENAPNTYSLNRENPAAQSLIEIIKSDYSAASGISTKEDPSNSLSEGLFLGQSEEAEELSDKNIEYMRERFVDVVLSNRKHRVVLTAIARSEKDIFSQSEIIEMVEEKVSYPTLHRIIARLKQFGIVIGVPKARRRDEEFLRRENSVMSWIQDLSKVPETDRGNCILSYLSNLHQNPGIFDIESKDIDPKEAIVYCHLNKGMVIRNSIPRIKFRKFGPVQNEDWSNMYGYQIEGEMDADITITDQTWLESSLDMGLFWLAETAFYRLDVSKEDLQEESKTSIQSTNDGIRFSLTIPPKFHK